MSEYDKKLAQGDPNSSGEATPPEKQAPAGSSQGDFLVFRHGDEEIRVPADAAMNSNFDGQQYQLTAKDVRDTYVPKGHGFENRMRKLAQREKEIREKFGEENLPLIDGLIQFKRERLNQLPPEEAEYLRRYLSGDPDVSFTRMQQPSRQGAQANHDYAPDDYSDPYGQQQQQAQLPPEVIETLRSANQSQQEMQAKLAALEQKLTTKDQEEAERRESERWNTVQQRIKTSIDGNSILKRAGKRAGENIMMKYLSLRGSDGELLHDLDLSIRLVEQEVKEEHGRMTTENLDQMLDDQRRFTTVEPGGVPATSPSGMFDDALKKMGKKPVSGGGGTSAIGKFVMEEYRQAERQRGRQ